MIQAGLRRSKDRLVWYAFQAEITVVLFVGSLLFWTFSESPARTLVAFMLIVVAAILSFLAPRWVLRFMAARRRQRVQHEVPLFIHLLVLLFESGLSTRQALASIDRKSVV